MNTFANMFDPIINPTLKNANFGPKILVKPKDIMGRPQAVPANPKNVISNATVDRASRMRNIERGYIGKTPRWAKPKAKQ